jgi:hypothetical protein
MFIIVVSVERVVRLGLFFPRQNRRPHLEMFRRTRPCGELFRARGAGAGM